MAFLINLDGKATDFLLVEEPLAIQHDDRRPDRLGARDDLERGYRFLDELGGRLSGDAKLAFEATYLAHLHGRERPGKVLGLARCGDGLVVAPEESGCVVTANALECAGMASIPASARSCPDTGC